MWLKVIMGWFVIGGRIGGNGWGRRIKGMFCGGVKGKEGGGCVCGL